MKMMKHRGLSLREKIGYSILAVYAVAALIFVVFCISLDMLPIVYIAVFGSCPAILGVLFAIMPRRNLLRRSSRIYYAFCLRFSV